MCLRLPPFRFCVYDVGHYLRENRSEWSPRHVGFFDTETYPVRKDDREELRLRLWVGGTVDRTAGPRGKLDVGTASGETRSSLAQWVDRACVGRPTVWLFAHNLGFDLTVSRLPDELVKLGWQLTKWNFAGRNVTARLRKRSKGLTLVDSTSWLPMALEKVGLLVDRHKLPMPAFGAPDEDWLEYANQDVLVLADAVLQLLDWWDDNKLGHWSTTGPGCGWNSARHMSKQPLLVVRDDPAEVKHDRSAHLGGRRDVTRVGEIEGGPFAQIDFSNAYLTVAASQLLPKGRLAHYDSFDPYGTWVDGNRFGVIAECEVQCRVPRYPFATASGTFYPVGRFRSVLASPEIVSARNTGDLVAIGPGYVHDLGYPLQQWARWALDICDGGAQETAPVVASCVKQWGRSVIGKFAARASTSTARGPALWPGWHLERGSSGPDHLPAADVHVAGRHWWVTFDQEGENAYPAVLAWVASYVRVALGRMLEQLGEDLWVCCDTDGAMLDLTKARSWLRERSARFGRLRTPWAVAEAVCEAVTPLTWPLVPRVKTLSHTLTVVGPQHYQADTFTRAAGRPGKPEQGPDGSLELWRWPKVKWQMEHGSDDGFTRVAASWTEPAQLAHRWVTQEGLALPCTARMLPDGTSGLVPWAETPYAALGMILHERQAPALAGLH